MDGRNPTAKGLTSTGRTVAVWVTVIAAALLLAGCGQGAGPTAADGDRGAQDGRSDAPMPATEGTEPAGSADQTGSGSAGDALGMETTTSPGDDEGEWSVDDEPEPAPVKPVDLAGLRRLIRAERYTTWAAAPGYARFRPGTGPHSARIRIWIDDVMVEALKKRPRPKVWPPGSTIVKEGYNSAGRLRLVAAMRKQADGKWFYGEWRPNGAVMGGGLEAPGCARCHARGQDSVRAFKLNP